VSVPKQVESIPTVTAPVEVPDAGPEMSRGRFLAGVITGGAALTVAAVFFAIAIAVTS